MAASAEGIKSDATINRLTNNMLELFSLLLLFLLIVTHVHVNVMYIFLLVF